MKLFQLIVFGLALSLAIAGCSDDDETTTGTDPNSPTELAIGESITVSMPAFGIYYVKFTAQSSSHTGSLTNLSSDYGWRLYAGSDFSSGFIGTCDAFFGTTNETCNVTGLNSGQTYYVRIDEWDNIAGNFTFVVN